MSWLFDLPWDAITNAAGRFNLDRLHVAAIVMTESSGNKNAERFEVNYRWLYKPESFTAFLSNSLAAEKRDQRTSFGYMQVMGAVCREFGYNGKLSDIKSNLSLHYGCMMLAKLLKKYSGNIHDATAAYNAGSVRKVPSGEYGNQEYVDRVMRFYNTLTKIAIAMKDA
jgi:soluble lytic murein transglycosylase-like protein